MIKLLKRIISYISNDIAYIKWVQLDKNGRMPNKSHAGDAGWDLYTSKDTYIEPYGTADIPVGIAAAMPPDVWFYIVGRSSTLRRRGLIVIPAVIDSDYTGELYVYVYNITGNTVIVNVGERIAQIIPYRHVDIEWTKTISLPKTSRNTDGFGSTGK